jgi:hypothetical protein
MGFRKFKCRKQVTKTDNMQVTTWVSTEYHPLVVKQVKIQPSGTEIRKLSYFDPADIDPYQLYRKTGRHWKVRTITGNGKNRTESTMEYKVKEVREDGATFSISVLDANGNSLFSQDTEIEFDAEAMAVTAATPEMEMVTKSCKAGKFQCYHSNAAGFESWTSVRWQGLIVASKMNNYEMELIEFDLGHDEHQFYRKTGNYYVLQKSNTTGEKVVQGNTTRVEVTDVGETEATYKVTVTNPAGEQVRSKR